jgi:hypothetical protein
MDKLSFLKTEFPKMLLTLAPEAKGEWGVMNGQQMAEHMADSVSQATGKNNQSLHTPKDMVEKYKSFAMSDKEFKPNTPNAMLPDVPPPPTKASMADAVAEYSSLLDAFIAYFEENKGAVITNPFFGDLNFEEWTHLLHKHAVHHSKQFRLM